MHYYLSSAEMAGRSGFGLTKESSLEAHVPADYRAMARSSLGDQADYLEYCSLSTLMQILLTQRILNVDPFEHPKERCGLILGRAQDPTPLQRAREIAGRTAREQLTQSLFREIDDHFWIRSFRFGSAHASLMAAQVQGPAWILEAPLRQGAATLGAIEDAFTDDAVDELLVLGSDEAANTFTREDDQEPSDQGSGPWAVALRLRRTPQARAMRLRVGEPEAVLSAFTSESADGTWLLRQVAENFLLGKPWSIGRFSLEPLLPEEAA